MSTPDIDAMVAAVQKRFLNHGKQFATELRHTALDASRSYSGDPDETQQFFVILGVNAIHTKGQEVEEARDEFYRRSNLFSVDLSNENTMYFLAFRSEGDAQSFIEKYIGLLDGGRAEALDQTVYQKTYEPDWLYMNDLDKLDHMHEIQGFLAVEGSEGDIIEVDIAVIELMINTFVSFGVTNIDDIKAALDHHAERQSSLSPNLVAYQRLDQS